MGPEAREIAAAVLSPRVPAPLALPSRPSFQLLRLTTVGLLAPPLRDAYGLRWSDRHERAFRLSAAATRRAVGILPPPLRRLPLPA